MPEPTTGTASLATQLLTASKSGKGPKVNGKAEAEKLAKISDEPNAGGGAYEETTLLEIARGNITFSNTPTNLTPGKGENAGDYLDRVLTEAKPNFAGITKASVAEENRDLPANYTGFRPSVQYYSDRAKADVIDLGNDSMEQATTLTNWLFGGTTVTVQPGQSATVNPAPKK